MRPHKAEQQEDIIVEKELRSMRRTLNIYIVACLSILVLLVGGWARAEVRIGSNTKEIQYTQENALNRKAFTSHIEAQEAYERAVAKIISNEEAREAMVYFNQRMQEINDRIAASQTEIVPRRVMEPKTKK